MGNCQAAEASTVLIEHPSGRVERAYWALSATHVMASNPGHYVAAVIAAGGPKQGAVGGGSPVKHLKLLRPDDTLHIGHVYRLVSFEEVLREFASKKHVKLSKLLDDAQKEKKEKSRSHRDREVQSSDIGGVVGGQVGAEAEVENYGRRRGATSRSGSAQWRPALQSIAEIESS